MLAVYLLPVMLIMLAVGGVGVTAVGIVRGLNDVVRWIGTCLHGPAETLLRE